MCAHLHISGRIHLLPLVRSVAVPQFAFVFPGQGSQYVGMGKALASASAAAAETFNTADVGLGEPLSRLMFEGPAEQLDQTVNSQPAILTHSVALLRVLQERLEGRPRAHGTGFSPRAGDEFGKLGLHQVERDNGTDESTTEDTESTERKPESRSTTDDTPGSPGPR